MKNKLLYFLVIISFIISQSVYAQTVPDAGLVEQSTPKGTELDQTDNVPLKPDGSANEVGSPDAAQPQVPETSLDQEQTSVLINSFNINQSQILSKEEIDGITNSYIGKEVKIDDLKKVIEDINTLYAKKGYISARAFLPPQTVKSGVIEIKLVEGHVGKILVEGNKWTKTSYIKGKISQQSGDLFEIKDLERDILKFNRENTIKLRANLKPGEEFGTTDIQLTAADPFPFHFTPTFDNTGRETVGVLRGGVGFTADSLFGYRDQFSMGYSRAKSTDVAYSSYNFPIGNKGTRIGGSFAFSNIKINSGFFKSFNIEGNSYNYSGYISQPFISTNRFDFSGDITANFRQVTTFFDETPLFTTQVRSLTTGLNFQYRDKWGNWMSRHAITNGLDLLGGNARFFKYDASLTRIQSFGHGIIGIFRGALQLSDDRLPPVEQFQIGGSTTVRGYSEGLLIGDNGYLLSAEIRFPIPFLPKEIGKLKLRDRIRALIFVDHGGAFIDDGEASTPHNYNFLTSVGLGIRGSITRFISGRVDWGFGIGNREYPQPTARLHFGLESNPF